MATLTHGGGPIMLWECSVSTDIKKLVFRSTKEFETWCKVSPSSRTMSLNLQSEMQWKVLDQSISACWNGPKSPDLHLTESLWIWKVLFIKTIDSIWINYILLKRVKLLGFLVSKTLSKPFLIFLKKIQLKCVVVSWSNVKELKGN